MSTSKKACFLIVLTFVLITLCRVEDGWASIRKFTVKDAIRLVSIQEQEKEGLRPSPDGKMFFVVEAYGDLEDNTRAFTLKVFEGESIFLGVQNLKPEAAVTLRTRTNEDAISAARWVEDGRAVAFLGVEGDGMPQPYRFDIASKTLTRLLADTPFPVVAFDVRDRTCVFLAQTGISSPRRSSAGWALTDESIMRLLFPEEANEFHEYALFVSTDGGESRQLTPAARSNFGPYSRFTISPDGKWAVGTLPPAHIPEYWNRYQLPSYAASYADSKLKNLLQFQLINLVNGEIRPLVDAPVGYVVNDFTPLQAIWNRSGEIVYLTNSMLPQGLESVKTRDRPAILSVGVGDAAKSQEIILSFSELKPGERIKTVRVSDDGLSVEVTTNSVAGTISLAPGSVGESRVLTFVRGAKRWGLGKERLRNDEGIMVKGGRLWISENANQPPRLMGTTREGEPPRVLLNFNPQLDGVSIQPIHPVSWKDKSGHVWHGGLALPVGLDGRKPPLIVALKFHDPSKFRPDGPYTTAFATQALVAKGFAVLELDSFDAATAGTAQEGPMQMRAVESSIDFAANEHDIDPNRVGLIGFSRTSYHVIYSLVNSSKRYMAAIVSDGVDAGYVQFQMFTLNHYGGAAGREFAQMQGGMPFGSGLDLWRMTSAMFNLDKVETPVRIEMIGRYSVLQEWELYSSLKLMNKPVEAIWIPEGTHVLLKPQERYLSQQGTVDWFDFWINGDESLKRSDAEQYSRWQELRQLQIGK